MKLVQNIAHVFEINAVVSKIFKHLLDPISAKLLQK